MPTYWGGVEVIRTSALIVDGDIDMDGHDIDLGAGKLMTTDLLLKQLDASSLIIKNRADTENKDLYANELKAITRIKTDVIDEYDAASGVTIDGVKCKDNHVFIASGGFVIWNEELALYRAASDQLGISDYPQTVNTRFVCSNINSTGTLYWMALSECGITDDTPASPTEGDIRLDSTGHHLEFYNGTDWVQLAEA